MRPRRLLAALLLGSSASVFAGTPWWAAFADPTLDQLMQNAAPADAAAQQALVENYIVARVDHTRGLLATRLLQAARDEEALLMNADPSQQRDTALAAVSRRLEQIEGNASQIALERDKVTAELALRCGSTPADLVALLTPTQGRPVLPRVDAPLPSGPAVENDTRRQHLAEQHEDVQRRSQLLEARRLEMKAHETRERAGAGDPVGALETYQQMVLDSDRLALASGRLALAWAQWLPSPAGR